MTEQPNDVYKFAFAWICIMITINTLYAGYITTSQTESEMFTELSDAIYGQNSPMYQANSTIQGYTPDKIQKESGSPLQFIFDALDQVFNVVKWVGFVVKYLLLGGIFVSWDMWGTIDNQWFKLLITSFLILGNVIFVVMIAKFLIRKGAPQ